MQNSQKFTIRQVKFGVEDNPLVTNTVRFTEKTSESDETTPWRHKSRLLLLLRTITKTKVFLMNCTKRKNEENSHKRGKRYLGSSVSPVFQRLVTCRAIVQNKLVWGQVRHRRLVIIVVKRHVDSPSLFTEQVALLVMSACDLFAMSRINGN